MGHLRVVIEFENDGDDFDMVSAGLVRTARKLASGRVYVPKSVWAGKLIAPRRTGEWRPGHAGEASNEP